MKSFKDKKKNWNMLHSHRCPACFVDLIPADHEGKLLQCCNAYNEEVQCDFKINANRLSSICSNLIVRVYA